MHSHRYLSRRINQVIESFESMISGKDEKVMASMFLVVLLSSFGMGYLIYGKKQHHSIALLSGIILCALPYFFSNILVLLLTGAIVMALPFIFRF